MFEFKPLLEKSFKQNPVWLLVADEYCEFNSRGMLETPLVFRTYYRYNYGGLVRSHGNPVQPEDPLPQSRPKIVQPGGGLEAVSSPYVAMSISYAVFKPYTSYSRQEHPRLPPLSGGWTME